MNSAPQYMRSAFFVNRISAASDENIPAKSPGKSITSAHSVTEKHRLTRSSSRNVPLTRPAERAP